MRRIGQGILLLCLLLSIAPQANADDFSFRIGYDTRNYDRRDHHDRSRHDRDRYYCNRGHYVRGFYYYEPVVVPVTVVRSYDVSVRDKILTSNEKLGISDIIVLSKAGVSEDAIIDKIARTRTIFDLSVEEVEALRREGVSARVINYMLNTKRK